jgi:hypothetical protein
LALKWLQMAPRNPKELKGTTPRTAKKVAIQELRFALLRFGHLKPCYFRDGGSVAAVGANAGLLRGCCGGGCCGLVRRSCCDDIAAAELLMRADAAAAAAELLRQRCCGGVADAD